MGENDEGHEIVEGKGLRRGSHFVHISAGYDTINRKKPVNYKKANLCVALPSFFFIFLLVF